MPRPPYEDVHSTSDARGNANLQRLDDERRRKAEFATQTSMVNGPEARIRIWERRHQLALPRNPDHRLIDVIAEATALTREQVLEAQLARLEPGTAPGGSDS